MELGIETTVQGDIIEKGKSFHRGKTLCRYCKKTS